MTSRWNTHTTHTWLGMGCVNLGERMAPQPSARWQIPELMAKKEQLIVVLKQVGRLPTGGTGSDCRWGDADAERPPNRSHVSSSEARTNRISLNSIYMYIIYIVHFFLQSLPCSELFIHDLLKGRGFLVATSSFRRWADFKGVVCQQEVAEEKENTLRVKARLSCSVGAFDTFFCVHPYWTWGNDPIWGSYYFSNGLGKTTN